MSDFAPFPWSEAMRFGFGILRLSPRDFWAMTPRELASAFEALSGRSRATPPQRQTLETLMQTYPDTEPDHGR